MSKIGLDYRILENGTKEIFVRGITTCCAKMAEEFFSKEKFEVKGVGPSANGIIPSLRLTEDRNKEVFKRMIFHYCPYCGSPVTFIDSQTGHPISTWTKMEGGLSVYGRAYLMKTIQDIEKARVEYVNKYKI